MADNGDNIKEGHFPSVTGEQLFFRYWLPDKLPVAMVTLVHGYAEHSGRYDHIAGELVSRGMGVAAFDLVGHGRSGGARAYIDSIDSCVADLAVFRAKVQKEFPGIAHPMFAHSMGGAISILAILSRSVRTNAIFLSSPAIKLCEPVWLQKASTILSSILPTLPTISINRNKLTTDKTVLDQADHDDLHYKGPTPLNTGAEMVKASEKILTLMNDFDTPFMIIHGSDDTLTSPQGSKDFYAAAQAEDKQIRIFEGLLHETFNSAEKGPTVVSLIGDWFSARV